MDVTCSKCGRTFKVLIVYIKNRSGFVCPDCSRSKTKARIVEIIENMDRPHPLIVVNQDKQRAVRQLQAHYRGKFDKTLHVNWVKSLGQKTIYQPDTISLYNRGQKP